MKGLFSRFPAIRQLYTAVRLQWFSDLRRITDESHLNRDWDFESRMEQERHGLVFAAVSRLGGDVSTSRALEIGCSDGVFTARLAASFASVTACDISLVACELAARRCRAFKNVVVREFDIAREEIRGEHDTVFAMDVFEYIHGRKNISAVLEKLVNALPPRGLLVFSGCRILPRLRDAWWQRWLPEGGDAVMELIARHPALRLKHREFHPADGLPAEGYLAHVIAVFVKEND